MTFNNWRAMESAMRSSEPQQRITAPRFAVCSRSPARTSAS